MKASDSTNRKTDRNQTFIFHEDSGHGWLQVPFDLLKELKIHTRITNCSYRKGDFAYLEEDLDRGTFLKAYFSYLQIPFNSLAVQDFWAKTETTYSDHSDIRTYRRYYL